CDPPSSWPASRNNPIRPAISTNVLTLFIVWFPRNPIKKRDLRPLPGQRGRRSRSERAGSSHASCRTVPARADSLDDPGVRLEADELLPFYGLQFRRGSVGGSTPAHGRRPGLPPARNLAPGAPADRDAIGEMRGEVGPEPGRVVPQVALEILLGRGFAHGSPRRGPGPVEADPAEAAGGEYLGDVLVPHVLEEPVHQRRLHLDRDL